MTDTELGTLKDLNDNVPEYSEYTFENEGFNYKTFGFFSSITGIKIGEDLPKVFLNVAASELGPIKGSNSGSYVLGRFVVPIKEEKIGDYSEQESQRKQVKYEDFDLSQAVPVKINDNLRFINLFDDLQSTNPSKRINVTLRQSDYSESFPISMPISESAFCKGYYVSYSGAWMQVINSEGELCSNVSGYTDGDKRWIKDLLITNLYAQWDYSYCTIKLIPGQGSNYIYYIKVIGGTNNYDNIPAPIYEEPARRGLVFDGYWTGEGGTGTQIIDANGYIINRAGKSDTYTDQNGNWRYNYPNFKGITLYAKWNDNRKWIEYEATPDRIGDDDFQRLLRINPNADYGLNGHIIKALSHEELVITDWNEDHTAIVGKSVCRIYFAEDPMCIPDGLFANLPRLKSITLPKSITTVGDSAFYNCCIYNKGMADYTGLMKVVAPGLQIIKDHAFEYCDNLQEVIINLDNSKITTSSLYIHYRAFRLSFSRTTGRTKIVDGESVSDPNIFSYNGNVSTIDLDAFSQSYIEKMNLLFLSNPYGITMDIKDNAFYECSYLKEFSGLLYAYKIGNQAFYECSKLLDVTGFERTVEFGYMAFYESHIQEITIKKDVLMTSAYNSQSVDNSTVFQRNTALTKIKFLGTRQQLIDRVYDWTLPSQFKPFYYCINLQTIECDDCILQKGVPVPGQRYDIGDGYSFSSLIALY